MQENSTPSPKTNPSTERRPNAYLALIAVVVITVIIVGVFLSFLATSTFVINTKNVPSYSASVSQNPNSPTSMAVTNTNGRVSLSTWSQTTVLINGTITARGFGASTDRVTFDRTNSTAMISFTVEYPSMMGIFASPAYTVDLNIYVPNSATLGIVQLTTTNGDVKASGLNASSTTLTTTNGIASAANIDTDTLTLTSTNGNLEFNCSASCSSIRATTTNGGVTGRLSSLSATGTYELTTTNGGVSLTLPRNSSFQVTARTTNGDITTSGLGMDSQTGKSLTATIRNGGASVHLTTTNGSVTVNGV